MDHHILSAPTKNSTTVAQFPRPTFHRVIIDPMVDEISKTIYVPDGVRDKPTQGKVMAVGPGRRTPEGALIPVAFEPGQVVVFNRFSGTEISFMRRTYLLVPEDEIIAIL